MRNTVQWEHEKDPPSERGEDREAQDWTTSLKPQAGEGEGRRQPSAASHTARLSSSRSLRTNNRAVTLDCIEIILRSGRHFAARKSDDERHSHFLQILYGSSRVRP